MHIRHFLPRLGAALLGLALLGTLGGCGQDESAPFRVLEELGERDYAVICRLNDRIAPQIDEAMNTLAAEGTLSALSLRWLGRDAVTLRAGARPEEPEDAEEAEEPEEPEAAEEPRVLIVGVETDAAPLSFSQNGSLGGLHVDIAAALGKTLGWEVRYQPISAGEVETQLSSGNIDCALGFDPGAVRPEKYSVGVTFLHSEIVLAVRQESPVRRLRDLRELTVGTPDDPLITALVKTDESLTKYAAGATVYRTPRRCLEALETGLCAAVVLDRMMLEHPETV